MRSICFVLGTRPEIIKLYPVIKTFKSKFNIHIVHTGQHYDNDMKGQFFKDLKIKPNYSLNLNTKKYNRKIFINKLVNNLSKIYVLLNSDFIITQGDTDSVLAATLAFKKNKKKIKSKLIHIEAGIRSFDKSMQEEKNRIIADRYSDILFAPTIFAKKNLLKEKISKKKIHVVGNTIADSINMLFKDKKNKKNFFYLTLHRVETVKKKKRFYETINTLIETSEELNIKIIFPIHPRTRKLFKSLNIKELKNLKLINPCGYLKSLSFVNNARIVITDSGGLQEESCILKTPCITVRNDTERQETLKIKSNILVGYNKKKIKSGIKKMLKIKKNWNHPYGQNVSKKILSILKKKY